MRILPDAPLANPFIRHLFAMTNVARVGGPAQRPYDSGCDALSSARAVQAEAVRERRLHSPPICQSVVKMVIRQTSNAELVHAQHVELDGAGHDTCAVAAGVEDQFLPIR